MTVAFEVQYDVDQVLENAWAGDSAVLGDVPDEHRGDTPLLGHRYERRGDGPDLRYAPGSAVAGIGGDRLHRIDDQQLWLDDVEMGQHGTEIVLGGDEQVWVDAAGALGTQPNLRRRLLARDDQRGPGAGGGEAMGDLEQQRGLADAGFAGQQHHRPRHQAAAEYAVELGDACGPGTGVVRIEIGDGPRRLRDRPRGDGAAWRARGLLDRAPCLALEAASGPAQGRRSALGASVCGFTGGAGLGHVVHASGGVRQSAAFATASACYSVGVPAGMVKGVSDAESVSCTGTASVMVPALLNEKLICTIVPA